TNVIAVGYLGAGELRVANGATLVDQLGIVSYLPGSVGWVTVAGAASTWANLAQLQVGAGGDGILDIVQGGTVSAPLAIVGDGFAANNSNASGFTTVDGPGSGLDIATR